MLERQTDGQTDGITERQYFFKDRINPSIVRNKSTRARARSTVDFQHRLSGTRCHRQFSSVILCLFLIPDLKLFCSIRLSPNTDPTCRQRLGSYDRKRYRNSSIIIIIIMKECDIFRESKHTPTPHTCRKLQFILMLTQ